MKTQTLWEGVIKYSNDGSRKKQLQVRIRMNSDQPVYVEYWEKENPGTYKWTYAGVEVSLETLKVAFLVRHTVLQQTANTITDSLNGME